MIARPYLIGLIVIASLALVIGGLATFVSPSQETVVDVIEPPASSR